MSVIKIKNWQMCIMWLPKVCILGGLALGVWLLILVPWYFGCGALVLTVLFFYKCFRRIPARPPHVGIVVVWGKRLPIVMPEGWHFLAPFFPFLYTVTMIKVEKVNLNLTFSDIRCRARRDDQKEGDMPWAGGEVSVDISVTYFPNYKSSHAGQRLISFLNSGEHEQVNIIIRDLLEEDVRQMASELTWEEVTFSAEVIKKKLVFKLTGQELTEQIAEELNKNGLPDVADLGIKISRFNVGKVKEQGDLAEAAGKFAKEVQEKRGELVELETIYQILKKMKRLGVPIREALDAIQAERGKAEKKIIAVRGVDQAATTLGAGLLAIGDAIGTKKKDGRKNRKKDGKKDEKDEKKPEE